MEFFSSFVHTTCNLSVSSQYLALDGVYHPLKTPLSRYPTLYNAPCLAKNGYEAFTLYRMRIRRT